MSKFYTIRSADGQRSYGSVTKIAAKGMVRRGEARFLPNCSVVQLTPPKEDAVCDEGVPVGGGQPKQRYDPSNRDFRGLSATPTGALTERYVHAWEVGIDSRVVDAVDAWAPKGRRPAPEQRAIQS